MKFLGGFELFAHPTSGGSRLESAKPLLRAGVGFDVVRGEGVILVSGEQDDLAKFALGFAHRGAVEFHFCDRGVFPVRHPAVAKAIYADVNVRLIDHLQ